MGKNVDPCLVLLHGLVEVLVPGGQGEAALVQLDHVPAGVLVILPDIPDEEAANIVIVLKLLRNCLKRILILKYNQQCLTCNRSKQFYSL